MRRLVLLAAILATDGCRPPGTEEQVLRVFFDASRARDTTVLAKVANVSLNPVTEGTVRDFELIGVGAEQRDGDIVRKPVTVLAQVHTPQSQTVSKTFVFTFQRTIGSGRADAARWTITALR